jgi:hypothetical protein
MSQDPEPLETVALNFNYEPGALRRAGVDPRTSEGKARIQALLIEGLLALKCDQLRLENRVVPEDCEGFKNEADEFWAILKSLLAEGP